MAEKPFSPAKAMGIPSKDYGQFWDDGSSMTFTADRGYSASPMMVTPFNALADQAARQKTLQAASDLEAQEDILGGGLSDPFTPQAKSKRMDYLARGVISPQQEALYQRMEEPAPATKYTAVPEAVVRATSVLETIDPTDADAWNKMSQALAGIDSSELGRTNARSHPYFRETLTELKRNILESRGSKKPEDVDDRLWFAMRGGDPSEFDKGTFNDPTTGKADRARMAHSLAQQKRQADSLLSSTERKALDTARENVQYARPETQAEAAMVLQGLIEDFEKGGKQIPAFYKQGVGGAPTQGPMVAQAQGLPRFNSVAEMKAANLPLNTRFVDAQGNIRTVLR